MAFPHEIVVELFRARPELARELLRACAGIEIAGERVELGSADLTQVASTEYHADAVAIVRGPGGAEAAAIIVEVQRAEKARKRLTWPLYVTALRAKLGAPVTLLVVVPDDALGRWARAPIEIGHPGFCLTPIVVTYADVPIVTDPDEAAAAPELAVLSAIAHAGDARLAPATAAALEAMRADLKGLYLDVILAAWPAAARKLLEELMLKPEVREEVRRLAYAAGVESGIERGRAEGRAETLRAVALGLARAKLGALDPGLERCPATLADEAALSRLVDALGRWARAPIEIGHPGFCLTPIVVTYADVPRVTDPAEAARAPELAVLSAIAHPRGAWGRAQVTQLVSKAADTARMPRTVRVNKPGSVYHLISRFVDREWFIRDERERLRYLDVLGRAVREPDNATIAEKSSRGSR